MGGGNLPCVLLPPTPGVAAPPALFRAWEEPVGSRPGVTTVTDHTGTDHVVVSSHACGRLTDVVLDRAVAARSRVAVLPCCHDLTSCDAGALSGWVAGGVAIDIMRAVRLEQQGYRIWTQCIPAAVTPKNRLLLGAPAVRAVPA